MNTNPILKQLAALADATRARLLLVLERHELAVAELCAVVQLPQSTVSRHLRLLNGEGWLTSRSEGTSHFYRLATGLSADARRVWEAVREPLSGGAEATQDLERAREVLARRRTRSQEFFSSAAGQWDSVRIELFGATPELPGLLALLDPGWVVGDLGCGTGGVAETIAPFVRQVVGVDESADMLAAAEARLARSRLASRVGLRPGRLEALPLDDGSLDVALFMLVLHYVAQPERALAEARRALRPGGRVLIVDMARHGRSEYREQMGHLWEGFTQDELEVWLRNTGFNGISYHPLPPAPNARGPLLFAATARAEGGRQNDAR
jgi:ubiquinone/menaquinone biosynthesis C-methylase UbiE/DNA-binding transcriptional ArsR family regulator